MHFSLSINLMKTQHSGTTIYLEITYPDPRTADFTTLSFHHYNQLPTSNPLSTNRRLQSPQSDPRGFQAGQPRNIHANKNKKDTNNLTKTSFVNEPTSPTCSKGPTLFIINHVALCTLYITFLKYDKIVSNIQTVVYLIHL